MLVPHHPLYPFSVLQKLHFSDSVFLKLLALLYIDPHSCKTWRFSVRFRQNLNAYVKSPCPIASFFFFMGLSAWVLMTRFPRVRKVSITVPVSAILSSLVLILWIKWEIHKVYMKLQHKWLQCSVLHLHTYICFCSFPRVPFFWPSAWGCCHLWIQTHKQSRIF